MSQGADPNSTNGLEMTPLYIAAASHQPDVVDLLLKSGAKVDATTTYGTPLIFASATANLPDAQKFLALGADPHASRGDGMNGLMFAANIGMPPLVAEYLKRQVDVNIEDDSGSTALSLAARAGNDAVVEMLIGAGASVELADEEGQTPLMAAAMNGRTKSVELLVKAKANVNAKDKHGRTALILANSYGDFPGVVKALVDAKADRTAKDNQGRTASAIAQTRGRVASAPLLGKPDAKALLAAKQPSSPEMSVKSSLKLLQSSMGSFAKGVSCVSCHQEGLGRIATGEAKRHGFALDKQILAMQSGRLNGMLGAMKPLHEGALKNPEVMKQIPLMEINEISSTDTWLLAGLESHGQPRDGANLAMANVLAKQQSKGGFWSFTLPRTPMQSSFFTFTALSVKAINAYGAQNAETKKQILAAKNWLMTAKVSSGEDKFMRLLGLLWSGASLKERQAAIASVRSSQHADGGWSQESNMASDAYATGQALYALRLAGGASSQDPQFKKGIQYLLKNQDADGSWFVNKRAIPANNYFDGGFPHGQSQYASFNGTCWAMMAMLQALPSK